MSLIGRLIGLSCLLTSVISVAFVYQRAHLPLLFTDEEDVWVVVLAGQSNMAGRGYISPTSHKATVSGLYVLNDSLKVVVAEHPVHSDRAFAGFSMPIDFAKKVLPKCDSCKLLLVPVAQGGTSVSQWQPGTQLTSSVALKVRYARQFGDVKAILWHQGERDVRASGEGAVDVKDYANLLTNTVSLLRMASGGSVPFVIGNLPEFLKEENDAGKVEIINEQIARVVLQTTNVEMVDLSDLDDMGDKLHFSTPSLKLMGERYAERFLSIEGML